jgi:Ran GTPase-activating protein (RanGAP) involved in mRNA processing and transport
LCFAYSPVICFNNHPKITNEFIMTAMSLSEILVGLESNTIERVDGMTENLSDQGLVLLASAMTLNTSCASLVLRLSSDLTEESVQCLANMLTINKTCTSLQVKVEGYDLSLFPLLYAILEHPTVLTKLVLDECSIDDDLAELLGHILKINSTLLSISLRQNDIGTDGTIAIAAALQDNTTLQELDLTENSAGEQGGGALASALQLNSTLQILRLADNEVGFGSSMSALGTMVRTRLDLEDDLASVDSCEEDRAYSMLAYGVMLRSNTSLKILDLSNNDDLISGCAIAIAQGLQQNFSLEEIILDSNPINSDGIEALANMLYINKVLLKMSLVGIMFDRDGIFALSEALEYNNVLQEMDLSKNIVDDSGAERLANMLRINKGLRILRLTENDIGDRGGIAICSAIAHSNSTLRELYLDENVITDIGAKSIGESLPLMQGLLTFKLNGNHAITEVGGENLVSGLATNTELLNFDFSNENLGGHSNVNVTKRKLLLLNHAGRRILKAINIPGGLWPLLLERSTGKVDAIFHFLREQPNLLHGGHRDDDEEGE